MTNTEKAEIAAKLYKIQGEIFVLKSLAQYAHSLTVATAAEKWSKEFQELQDELNPPPDIPTDMEFPRRKF